MSFHLGIEALSQLSPSDGTGMGFGGIAELQRAWDRAVTTVGVAAFATESFRPEFSLLRRSGDVKRGALHFGGGAAAWFTGEGPKPDLFGRVGIRVRLFQ